MRPLLSWAIFMSIGGPIQSLNRLNSWHVDQRDRFDVGISHQTETVSLRSRHQSDGFFVKIINSWLRPGSRITYGPPPNKKATSFNLDSAMTQ